MKTPQQCIDWLQSRKGGSTWKQVSQIGGVDYMTLAKLARSKKPRPSFDLIERVNRAIAAIEALEALNKARGV